MLISEGVNPLEGVKQVWVG